MKAISLHQPSAHLMAIGAKRIETRGWKTDVRGWVLIHAALKWTKAQREMVADWPEEMMRGFATGAVVCAVRLVDCVRVPDDCCELWDLWDRGTEDEEDYGDYSPGRFAWVTDAVVRLVPPVPWRGRQGWFDVPERELPMPEMMKMFGRNAGDVADRAFVDAVRKDGEECKTN